MVITVQAPRWIRSPSWRGVRTPAVISLPLTRVPFSDPGSRIVQLPSGSANNTACNREMPGSVGGPVRSISGSRSRDTLRRPMRISGPASRNRRSGVYPGNSTVAALGPPAATTFSKYARSLATIAVHAAGLLAAGAGPRPARAGPAGGGPGPVPDSGTLAPSIEWSPLPASPPGAALAATGAAGVTAASKSNPQDSQNRPDLPAPQRGQGRAGPAGPVGTDGCASGEKAAGGAAGTPAGTPIVIPQTSQKSLLAEV